MRTVTSPFAGYIQIPKDMIFCDLTLREGEQSPGVSFTEEEKIDLVKKLDDIGINQIQLTTPGTNRYLLDLNARICRMGLQAKLEIMTSAQMSNWMEQIDLAAVCDPDIIHAGFEISRFNQKKWDDSVKRALMQRIQDAAAYIKKTGKLVNISLCDATRSEFTFLLDCVQIAASAGANRIRICDSFGVGTPEAFTMAVSNAVRIAEPYGCIIGVHCHNDFGLALANTIACIKAGAKLVDLCANGMGDRAGNTCLIEAMVSLEALYHAPTGLKVEKATELAKYVEEISGVKIPVNKPFVGANVFCEEAAGHAMEQFNRPVEGRSIVPEDIGGKLSVIYGKLTNKEVLSATAMAAGRDIPEQYYQEILKRLYIESEKSKGVPLYEKDLWKIIDEIVSP